MPPAGWVSRKFGSDNLNAHRYILYYLSLRSYKGLLLSGTAVLYLTMLTNSVATVGYAEGVFGFLALVPGLIGGYFADKGRRDRVLRWGGVLGALGVLGLLCLCTLYLASADLTRDLEESIPDVGSYQFFFSCVGISTITAASSVSDAAAKAILNDSLHTGKRRLAFNTALYFYGNACYGVGPVVVAILSLLQDNKWSIRHFVILVIVGVCAVIPNVISCFLFDDNDTLRGASDSVTAAEHNTPPRGGKTPPPALPTPTPPAAPSCCTGSASGGEPDSSAEGETAKLLSKAAEVPCGTAGACCGPGDGLRQRQRDIRKIPIIYSACDLLWCLGSGMTAKFFPVFFKDMLGLSPAGVFLVQSVVPFSGMPILRVVEWLCHRIGRIQTDLLLWYAGITCLAGMSLMGYLNQYGSSSRSRGVLITLYIIRCACLQATTPVQESVVMDYIPKEVRARWAAFAAVVSFGWSGSAALGGILIEKDSYELAFLTTCVLHIASVVLKYPLLFIVPKEMVQKADTAADGGGGPAGRMRCRGGGADCACDVESCRCGVAAEWGEDEEDEEEEEEAGTFAHTHRGSLVSTGAPNGAEGGGGGGGALLVN